MELKKNLFGSQFFQTVIELSESFQRVIELKMLWILDGFRLFLFSFSGIFAFIFVRFD